MGEGTGMNEAKDGYAMLGYMVLGDVAKGVANRRGDGRGEMSPPRGDGGTGSASCTSPVPKVGSHISSDESEMGDGVRLQLSVRPAHMASISLEESSLEKESAGSCKSKAKTSG